MRVLYLTEESDRAEAALMLGTMQRGYEVLVFGNSASPALQGIAARGVTVRSFPVSGRFDLGSAARLRRILVEWRPAVVHAFTSRGLSIATFASMGLSIPRIGYRGTAGNLSWLNPADWLTYLHPRLSRIMCVSEAVRVSLLAMKLPERRLATIYKGHDIAWYAGDTSRAALCEIGIPDKALIVGCNANMRPVKGVDVLLEAARLLPTDGSLHYLLVGEVRDPAVQKLAQLPHLRSIVHLPGYRSDGTALMRACDIFVMPSRAREGLPKALIEAMAGARPVIASNVGGIPEVVRSGTDGLLVPPEEPSALAAAIERLAKEPALRQSLGENARKRIENAFSVGASVDRLIALYSEIAAD